MEKLYEGKSKVVYSSEEPGTCIIKYKDTATAGNGVKKEDLPGKGKLNAAISNIIFDYLMKNGVKTHLLKVIDETTVLAKKAEIVMVEVIVRAQLQERRARRSHDKRQPDNRHRSRHAGGAR